MRSHLRACLALLSVLVIAAMSVHAAAAASERSVAARSRSAARTAAKPHCSGFPVLDHWYGYFYYPGCECHVNGYWRDCRTTRPGGPIY